MAKEYKPYWEKLRDPRWQKKRLEIMERDGFECCDCGTGALTLNVHHCYYEKGVEPWEYPNQSLKTLCEGCHEVRHGMKLELERILSEFSLLGQDAVLGFTKQLDTTRTDEAHDILTKGEVAGAVLYLASSHAAIDRAISETQLPTTTSKLRQARRAVENAKRERDRRDQVALHT